VGTPTTIAIIAAIIANVVIARFMVFPSYLIAFDLAQASDSFASLLLACPCLKVLKKS
jgi:hypothetical protein